MSIDSHANIWCTFPKGTETHTDTYHIYDLYGRSLIDDYYDRVYSDHLLDDLVAFFGKPLDQVPGIELHVSYETWDDGYFRMEFDIVDGKKYYRESFIEMRPQPMSECPFDYGQAKGNE